MHWQSQRDLGPNGLERKYIKTWSSKNISKHGVEKIISRHGHEKISKKLLEKNLNIVS